MAGRRGRANAVVLAWIQLAIVDVLLAERTRVAGRAHTIGLIAVRNARGSVQTCDIRAVVDESVAVIARPSRIA